MNLTSNNYCVILAGGRGHRLWPVSRERNPKQFIDFFNVGRTLLQQTFDRFAKFIPRENIFVNTSEEYLQLVKEQLPELADDHIMAEPIHRNTAPSVAWAAHRIIHINPRASIVVTPSDQTISDEDAFRKNIEKGLEFVSWNDSLLTMGIRPTRPEPGYGYIQEGEQSKMDNIYKVKAFTEKPDREFAQMFVDSGEWYWNTGMFLANARYLNECMSQILSVALGCREVCKGRFSVEEENAFIRESFPSYPNLSIDYGILEKSDNVYVLKCNFGWADLGTWNSIYEANSRGEGDNVIIDSNVIIENSKGNVIKVPKERLVVVDGLEGHIVVEHDNVLLICRKETSSALILKYINEVQMKKGEEFV